MNANIVEQTDEPAVILFSHGSLLCGAGISLEAHASRMRQMSGFRNVEVGYLNYSTPSFAEAVDKVSASGQTSIVVVPYFLAPGYFVTTSLPKMIANVAPSFPNMTFAVAEPIGYDNELADAVIAAAQSARPPELWRNGLIDATHSCQMRDDCPIYGWPGCRANNSAAVGDTSLDQAQSLHTETAQKLGDRGPSAALLVLAHGSPNADANVPMLEVLERVAAVSDQFATIQVGYLECNQPSIADAIDLCAEAEPAVIVTVPYFLHMGAHVASDLPDALDMGRERYPHIRFTMGEYIGNMPQVTNVLARRACQVLPDN